MKISKKEKEPTGVIGGKRAKHRGKKKNQFMKTKQIISFTVPLTLRGDCLPFLKRKERARSGGEREGTEGNNSVNSREGTGKKEFTLHLSEGGGRREPKKRKHQKEGKPS